jgi:hypothetical protein
MKIRALCPISRRKDSRKRHEMRLIFDSWMLRNNTVCLRIGPFRTGNRAAQIFWFGKWSTTNSKIRTVPVQLQTALILSVTFIWSHPWVGLNGLWSNLALHPTPNDGINELFPMFSSVCLCLISKQTLKYNLNSHLIHTCLIYYTIYMCCSFLYICTNIIMIIILTGWRSR